MCECTMEFVYVYSSYGQIEYTWRVLLLAMGHVSICITSACREAFSSLFNLPKDLAPNFSSGPNCSKGGDCHQLDKSLPSKYCNTFYKQLSTE